MNNSNLQKRDCFIKNNKKELNSNFCNKNNFFHSLYEVECFLNHFSLFIKAAKISKILKK